MDKKYPRRLADFPPPETAQLERQVLADLVGNPDTISEVENIITRDMFIGDDRRAIYDALRKMYYDGERIDYSTIFGRVGQRFVTEIINGGSDMGATASDTINHADALRSADTRLRAYQSAVSLLNLSIEPNVNEETIFAEAESISTRLQGVQRKKEEFKMTEVVNAVANEIQEKLRLAQEGKSFRIPTGFQTLDSLTLQGFGPGQLIILAARPSVGKTAVMLQMARTSAGAGFPTAIFSLEMTASELGERMLYSTGYIDPLQVATGSVNWERFEIASAIIGSLPITINDSSRTLREIVSKIQVLSRNGKCRIAFIDYLGLVKDTDGAKLPLREQIANITGALKAVAKSAKIPIVLLCQLNRASASEDRPPQLFDLRDSGSIEQDSDVVIMLEGKENQVNMWLRKNRQFRKEACITIEPNSTYTQFKEVGMQG